jgi:hypothetical protein
MSVDAAAFVQGTNTLVCSPAEKLSSPFNVSAGGTVTAPQIDFTGCD